MPLLKTTKVSKSIYDLLRNDPSMKSIDNITYGDFTNDNMMQVPWVGVYRGPVIYSPWTMPNGWKTESEYRIIVQEGGFDEGADVEARLEDIVYNISTIIANNRTISGLVHMVTGVSVEYSYFNDADHEDVHFQRADILIKCETRSQV